MTLFSSYLHINSSGINVAEGSNGFDSSYDVYLRPCSGEMLDAISIELTPSVPDQIEFDPLELTGTHFTAECKATISVSAIDDDLVEGIHHTTILHNVRNVTNGELIRLMDGTPLYAKNVLVTVYDDDMVSAPVSHVSFSMCSQPDETIAF